MHHSHTITGTLHPTPEAAHLSHCSRMHHGKQVLSIFLSGIFGLLRHSPCFLPPGRILVHCAVGVSRSATLVLAYLMIRHHMPLVEAIKTVKDHRGIIPNRGFLRQLVALDNALRLKRSA